MLRHKLIYWVCREVGKYSHHAIAEEICVRCSQPVFPQILQGLSSIEIRCVYHHFGILFIYFDLQGDQHPAFEYRCVCQFRHPGFERRSSYCTAARADLNAAGQSGTPN
jgi:hypothetical protein